MNRANHLRGLALALRGERMPNVANEIDEAATELERLDGIAREKARENGTLRAMVATSFLALRRNGEHEIANALEDQLRKLSESESDPHG